ncbi:hypothetical protein [Neisseria musculi]|uniref:hypothetical protein n=1 Tax=Neisseria musculi TaxID=1815583 RepID=UPI00361572CE
MVVQLNASNFDTCRIVHLLADTHAALLRALVAQRILVMMLVNESKTDKLAYCLLCLY